MEQLILLRKLWHKNAIKASDPVPESGSFWPFG
jgi:hypothetical protein